MELKCKVFLRYCTCFAVIGALLVWPAPVHSAVVGKLFKNVSYRQYEYTALYAMIVIGARPYLERVAKRVVEILEGRYISGNSLPIADYVAPIQ